MKLLAVQFPRFFIAYFSCSYICRRSRSVDNTNLFSKLLSDTDYSKWGLRIKTFPYYYDRQPKILTQGNESSSILIRR